MRDEWRLGITVLRGTRFSQMYISVAYGSSWPVSVRILSKKMRSSNGSLSLSPANETTTRTGESSVCFCVLSALAMRPSTFQRQDSSG